MGTNISMRLDRILRELADVQRLLSKQYSRSYRDYKRLLMTQRKQTTSIINKGRTEDPKEYR